MDPCHLVWQVNGFVGYYTAPITDASHVGYHAHPV